MFNFCNHQNGSQDLEIGEDIEEENMEKRIAISAEPLKDDEYNKMDFKVMAKTPE